MPWIFTVPSFAIQANACFDHAFIIEALASKHGEIPIAVAVDHTGKLVEVLASQATGAWTIVVTSPATKIACIAGTGDGWRPVRVTEGPET